MKTLPILEPTPEAIERAVAYLRDGEIIICPSDANYGIAVDPFNENAVLSCFDIKKRSGSKPLTLFIADPRDWKLFGQAENEKLVDDLSQLYWPGPLNIVLEKKQGAPNLSLSNDTTISIACHANPVVRQLAHNFGGAIAMTSANLSGMSDDNLVNIDTAIQHVGASVKLVLRGGNVNTTRSTTIVKVNQSISLIREGDLSFEQIQSDIFSRNNDH